MKNHYDLLGLSPDATPEEIKDAYRMMAMVWHPDRFSGNLKLRKFAEERFKEINGAYEVLSDPAKRRTYDEEGRFVTQKPKPVVAPKIIDFGEIEHGGVVSKAFQVENQGGPAKELNFDYPPGSWFQLGKITPVSEKEMFPLKVDVRVETEELSPGETYEGNIIVDLDGEKAEVKVRVMIVAVQLVSTFTSTSVPTAAPSTVDTILTRSLNNPWPKLLLWFGTIGGPLHFLIWSIMGSSRDETGQFIVAASVLASVLLTPLGAYLLVKTDNLNHPQNANWELDEPAAILVMVGGGLTLAFLVIETVLAICGVIIGILFILGLAAAAAGSKS